MYRACFSKIDNILCLKKHRFGWQIDLLCAIVMFTLITINVNSQLIIRFPFIVAHRREHLSDEDIKANESKVDLNNLHKTLSDGPKVSNSVCNISSCVLLYCVLSCSIAN